MDGLGQALAAAFAGGGTMTLAIGALVLFAVAGVAFALFGDDATAAARARRQRLGTDAGRATASFMGLFRRAEPTAADRLKELQDEAKRRRSVSLRQRLEQAGKTMAPARFMVLFQLLGAGAGAGVVLGAGLSWPFGVGAAAVVAFAGPGVYLRGAISKRRDAFLTAFPGGIDVLVRGVRAGMPVNESLKVIGQEIQEPVGGEMRRVVAGTQLGQSLEDSLAGLAARVPSADVNFFRTVLAIQKQTGGNLAESLENLSDVLRERLKLKKKIRALSSEARMSAIIIGSLPFAVTGLLYVLRPEYLQILFTDIRGNVMIGVGLCWMAIGVVVMRSMIKFEM